MNPQLAFLLSKSLDYLRASNLDAAEPLLLQALPMEPNNPDTLRFLGIIYAQRKDYTQALKYLEAAVKVNPQNGIAHSNQGNVLFELGQLEEAVNAYDKAIKLAPTYAEAWSNKGNVLYELRRYQEALEHHDRAIALQPAYAEAWSNKGNALYELELYEEALRHHDRAINLNPSYAEAWSNKGLVLNHLKDFKNALVQHDKAISLRPMSAKAWINKGMTYSELEQHQDALALYDKAIELNPHLAEAWTNKGNAVYALGRPQESITHHQRAIDLKPDYAQAWYNLAISYTALKRYPESISAYEQAIRHKPNYEMAYWNKSLVELVIGDFHNGWRNFEARAFIKNSPLRTSYNAVPRLQSLSDLSGKKVLIWSEQGLGDAIQFCRYIPELAKLGAEVSFITPPALASLMESLDGSIRVIDNCNDISGFDLQAPLMSLPLIFKTEIATIPSSRAYLRPNPIKEMAWKQKLGSTGILRVGLVWSGGFRPNQPEMHAVNERRNIPLKIISRLQHLNNIEFYSLQKGDPAESELKNNKSSIWPTNNLLNFVSELKDFSDTAALIANLDLVISVDTSTAHLSAALGKRTWILNRYDTCWRWLEDRLDSPWYQSVTLYRQNTPGNWGQTIELVEKDLQVLAQQHCQGF
jgi:hypothetical protein